MKFVKKFISGLVAATLITSMTGCGKANTSTSTENEVVTLTMIESITSPDRTELLKELIGKFEKENPNIKVELISPPLQNADDKINQMLMSKQPVDVLEVRDNTIKQFLNNKYIENLDPYMEDWEGKDTLVDVAKIKAKEVGGDSYLIPYGFYEKLLFYRADWFKEKGLEPPKTWDELYEIGKQFTDPSNNRYGYSFRGGAGSMGMAFLNLQANLGDILDTKSSLFTTDGKTIFDQQEAIDGMNLLKKIYTDLSPKDSVNWGYPEMVQGFYSGTTAMLIQDPEVIATCKEKMEDGTWATAPLPVGTSGKAYFSVGYAGWGMTSYSEHKPEAWKLIAFLSNEENNTYFSKENSLIPIHKSAADDEFFKNGPYKANIDMNSDSSKYVPVGMPFDYKGWGPFAKIGDQDLQRILLDDISVEDAMKKWSEFWMNEKKNK